MAKNGSQRRLDCLRASTKHYSKIGRSLVFTLPHGLTARVIPTAAVERALFHRARSGSKGMPWLRDPPLTAAQTKYFQLFSPPSPNS